MAAAGFDHKEHVETPQGHRPIDVEEIARQHGRGLGAQELPPRGPGAVAFSLIRTPAESKDLGARLGANDRSLQATPGHNQLASVQLDGSLSDTRRHTASLRPCLISSGSRVRILPGAPTRFSHLDL